MEKNANGMAFVIKKNETKWKESSIWAQRKKIVTYINAEEENCYVYFHTIFQMEPWLLFFVHLLYPWRKKIKAEEENCVPNGWWIKNHVPIFCCYKCRSKMFWY